MTALTRLLDAKTIEAQGFRSCMNVLDLGKRGNRLVLEQACRQLTDSDGHRQISYTAVKHAIAAIRAEQDARPSTDPQARARTDAPSSSRPPSGRDTSRAHLAGISAFRLSTTREY